jgi:hypothetical protein
MCGRMYLGHNEPLTRSSEMCEMPDTVHSVIHVKCLLNTELTFVGLKETGLENDFTIVVNLYDVVSPNPDCFKSDIIECYRLEKCVRIYMY